MGSLIPQLSGLVYLDASPIIYAVEKVAPYAELLQPIWQSSGQYSPNFVGSELLLLETLVKPVTLGDQVLQRAFRHFLYARGMRLVPINTAILHTAVEIRAAYKLKTPDAIHAATALHSNCQTLISNDAIFRRIPNLNVILLDELHEMDK